MLKNGTKPYSATWPVIFAILIEEYGVIPDKNKTLEIFEKGVQNSKPARTIYHPFISTRWLLLVIFSSLRPYYKYNAITKYPIIRIL